MSWRVILWEHRKYGTVYLEITNGRVTIDYTLSNNPPDQAYINKRANSATTHLHVYVYFGVTVPLDLAIAPPFIFYSYTYRWINTVELDGDDRITTSPAPPTPPIVFGLSLDCILGLKPNDRRRLFSMLMDLHDGNFWFPRHSSSHCDARIPVMIEAQEKDPSLDMMDAAPASPASSATLEGDGDFYKDGNSGDCVTGPLWGGVPDFYGLLPKQGSPEIARELLRRWPAYKTVGVVNEREPWTAAVGAARMMLCPAVA